MLVHLLNLQYPVRITTNSNEKSKKINLNLPINPTEHSKFDVEITYDDRSAPKGIELISSLVTTILPFWRDTANGRINTRIDERQRPFPRFHYVIRPATTLGADLTRLEVGLAMCHILSGVLRRDPWPGRISAKLIGSTIVPRRENVPIGYIEIANSPTPGMVDDDDAAAAVSTSANTSHSTSHIDGTGLSVPSTAMKRWLVCFARFLFFAFQHPASGYVTDEPAMSAEPEKYTYEIPCGAGRDEFYITIYPAANADSAWRMSWDRLVRAMLVWIVEVATQGEHLSLQQKVVREGGVIQAILFISIGPLMSDKSDDAVMPA
ncbi:MAG: hypothetical protein Q9223_002092 [Gallowayella weberi]